MQDYFTPTLLKYGNRNKQYNTRPFKFKFLLGGPIETKSDSISYIMSLFSWNIRAGNLQEAFTYLPDTIKSLSYNHSVAIITIQFYFYEVDFQADHASGSTGLQLIPNCILVVLKNGTIQYFRVYRKGIACHKFLRDPNKINKFTRKLFDKLK